MYIRILLLPLDKIVTDNKRIVVMDELCAKPSEGDTFHLLVYDSVVNANDPLNDFIVRYVIKGHY